MPTPTMNPRRVGPKYDPLSTFNLRVEFNGRSQWFELPGLEGILLLEISGKRRPKIRNQEFFPRSD